MAISPEVCRRIRLGITRCCQRTACFLALIGVLDTVGCGRIVEPFTPVLGSGSESSPNSPNSNWALAGDRAQGVYPVLAFAIFVQGNQGKRPVLAVCTESR